MNPVLVDRVWNVGTDRKPIWRRLRYVVRGENICDRFPDESAHEIAVRKTVAMLKKKS